MREWLLLVLSLPTENTTARMRAWRTLKVSGAAVLRDGVYLMPAGSVHRERLEAVAHDISESGGVVYLLALAETDQRFSELFDRTEEYRKLADEIAASHSLIQSIALDEAARQLKKLRKAFNQLGDIDFFPGEARRQVGELLTDVDRSLQARISPGEPTDQGGQIVRCRTSDYQGRLWATRQHLWVDRLASAWLIRRFIDPQARFLWFDTPAHCPPDALGFDFDGAIFTHANGRVTFEVLTTTFGLDGDPAIVRLGALVHCLDVGGVPIADAPGIKAVLTGLRATNTGDDSLLAQASRIFDSLYHHYRQEIS